MMDSKDYFFDNKEEAEKFSLSIGCTGVQEVVSCRENRMFFTPCQDCLSKAIQNKLSSLIVTGYKSPGCKVAACERPISLTEELAFYFSQHYDYIKRETRLVLKKKLEGKSVDLDRHVLAKVFKRGIIAYMLDSNKTATSLPLQYGYSRVDSFIEAFENGKFQRESFYKDHFTN